MLRIPLHLCHKPQNYPGILHPKGFISLSLHPLMALMPSVIRLRRLHWITHRLNACLLGQPAMDRLTHPLPGLSTFLALVQWLFPLLLTSMSMCLPVNVPSVPDMVWFSPFFPCSRSVSFPFYFAHTFFTSFVCRCFCLPLNVQTMSVNWGLERQRHWWNCVAWRKCGKIIRTKW